jgi:ABC-type Fe3+ transport system permease subunit
MTHNPPTHPPRSTKTSLDRSALLTATPAALIALICCVLPLLWMLAAIIANPDVRSELKMTQFRAALLERTLLYNGAAAIIATAMGLPAGLILGRGRGCFAKILWVILPAALLMPSLSYAYGWSQFVRLSRPFFRPMGITFIPGGNADILRCIWSLAAWLWAVPAGLIGLALRRLDPNVQQQALLDGALYRVTFRQLAGPIIASLAVVTVLATQEFAVYEPTGISVVATEVRMVFDTGAMSSPDNSIAGTVSQGSGAKSPDQPARAAAAVATDLPLLCITILLSLLAIFAANRASAAEEVTVGPWPKSLDAPRWAAIVAAALVLLNIGLPVWSLVASLREPFSIPYMWTEFGPQVQGAMIVAAIAASVAAIAAFSAAGQWTPGLIALAGASFLVGGQLLAIALIRIYNRPWLDWAYNAFPVPVIAYVGRFGWLSLAAGRGTWTRPWRELRDMSSIDGASTFRTALSVVWPLAWPTLLAGGLLVGALSLTEVPATVLLFPQNPQVLTPMLMTWVHMARFDPMIQASLLMMIAVLVPALLALALFWIASHGKRTMLARTFYRGSTELAEVRDAKTQRKQGVS